MKAAAYCAKSFADVARQVVGGVEPTTCPWVDSTTFDFKTLEGVDFWYIDLHGEPGWPMWFGDNGVAAMRAEQLEAADLGHLIIFAANCYLADDNSPMLHALLKSKPRAVVAAPGKNFSPPTGRLYGASLLAKWTFSFLKLGMPIDRAVDLGKMKLKLDVVLATPEQRAVIEQANKDALEFQVFKGR